MRFAHQVFLALIGVSLMLILLLGLVSSRLTADIVREQTSVALEDVLRLGAQNVDQSLQQVQLVADFVNRNPRFEEILARLKAGERDLSYLLDSFRYIVRTFDGFEGNNAVHRVRLYVYGGSILGLNRRYVYGIDEWSIAESASFPSSGIYVWKPTYPHTYPFDSAPTRILSLQRFLHARNDLSSKIGILSVDILEEWIVQILQSITKYSSGFMVLSGSDEIITSLSLDPGQAVPDDLLAMVQSMDPAASSSLIEHDGKEYLAVSYPIRSSYDDWRLSALMTRADITGRSRDVLRVTYLLMALGLLISAVVSGILARQVTGGITELQRYLTKMKAGEYAQIPTISGPREIAELQGQYNAMSGEIRRLIEEVYKTTLRRQKAELQALEGQINPHFLYNTLDTMKWMTKRLGHPELALLLGSLSTFFRVSLSRGAEIIPLHDEIAHVRSYLDIQSIRFRESLQTSFDVDKTLTNVPVLKLILQPLVENAIVHGIQKRAGRKGSITVRASALDHDHIELSVVDDGCGMSAEQLDSISRTTTSGYGIRNVDQRLQLYYGPDYGVSFESKINRGTVARIVLPMRPDGGSDTTPKTNAPTV